MRRLVVAAVATWGCLAVPWPAQAQTTSDDEAVRNQITCYPFGIDKIGGGDEAAGLAIWKQCFAPDFAFSAFIGRGEPTDCPGAKCPFPKEMGPIDMRVAFARRAFEGGGFVKTSHHLTNITTSFVSADQASVASYVQAWHWKADGTVVVAPGTWDVQLVRTGSGWRITREKLSVVGAAVVPPPAPAAPRAPAEPR
jgi:SnoaL-like domain